MTTYIQLGSATKPPMATREVKNKTTKIPEYALTNQNKPHPTSLKVLFNGCWRRVYANWDSSFYINYDETKVTITTS